MKDPTLDHLVIGLPVLLIVVGIFTLVTLENYGHSNQVEESYRHLNYGQTLRYRCWQARNYPTKSAALLEEVAQWNSTLREYQNGNTKVIESIRTAEPIVCL